MNDIMLKKGHIYRPLRKFWVFKSRQLTPFIVCPALEDFMVFEEKTMIFETLGGHPIYAIGIIGLHEELIGYIGIMKSDELDFIEITPESNN